MTSLLEDKKKSSDTSAVSLCTVSSFDEKLLVLQRHMMIKEKENGSWKMMQLSELNKIWEGP